MRTGLLFVALLVMFLLGAAWIVSLIHASAQNCPWVVAGGVVSFLLLAILACFINEVTVERLCKEVTKNALERHERELRTFDVLLRFGGIKFEQYVLNRDQLRQYDEGRRQVVPGKPPAALITLFWSIAQECAGDQRPVNLRRADGSNLQIPNPNDYEGFVNFVDTVCNMVLLPNPKP